MDFFDPPWEELQHKPFSLSAARRSIEADRKETLERMHGVRSGDVLPMIASPRHRMEVVMTREVAKAELEEQLLELEFGSVIQRKIATLHGPRVTLVDLRLDSWLKYKRIAKELEGLAEDKLHDVLDREKCRLIEHGIALPYVRHLQRADLDSAHALADRALQEAAPIEPISLEKLSTGFVTAMLYNVLNAEAEVLDMLERRSSPPIRPRPAS
jgi:hypothetical protein